MDDPLKFFLTSDSILPAQKWVHERQITAQFKDGWVTFTHARDAVMFAQEFIPEAQERHRKWMEIFIRDSRNRFNEVISMMGIELKDDDPEKPNPK